MGREEQSIERIKEEIRQKKVFVIATEGKITEIKYFQFLFENKLLKKDIRMILLPTEDGDNKPSDVYKRLEKFVESTGINELNSVNDDFWIVIDRDKQSINNSLLNVVLSFCKTHDYGFGLSSPCFELWFLLHSMDISKETKEYKSALYENRRVSVNGGTFVEVELRKKQNSYNKCNPKPERFIKKTDRALENAQKLGLYSTDKIPSTIICYVYKLIEQIINKEKINELAKIPL